MEEILGGRKADEIHDTYFVRDLEPTEIKKLKGGVGSLWKTLPKNSHMKRFMEEKCVPEMRHITPSGMIMNKLKSPEEISRDCGGKPSEKMIDPRSWSFQTLLLALVGGYLLMKYYES